MSGGLDLAYTAAGAFVAFLVGLTGVGGGSLMAPILIFVGVHPTVAVGTDLWFAAITKAVGGAVHHRIGTIDWLVVRRLALGSIPAAIVTLIWLYTANAGRLESDLLLKLLGIALLLSAAMMVVKPRIQPALEHLRMRQEAAGGFPRQTVFTGIGAAMVGALVTLTSIGAGALVAVLLTVLYPLRLDTKAIVGTDIVHAVPLALVAALGHSVLGNVDLWLLASLLVGSIPGIVVGSLVAGKVNENWVRTALAAMLAVAAIKMLAA